MKIPRLIVVLGMHRSGTSAVTRALGVLGVGLGNDLHPAASDNPKGFWEDKECLEINEAILHHLGSAYDRLGFAWTVMPNDNVISTLRLRASRLVTKKLNENLGIWGFKDPRTCRLLSFWIEVFQAVGCHVSYVIALRNPASVADSLVKRNSISAEKSYMLWLQHMLPAIIQTENTNRLIIDYDEFLDAPYTQMSRMASALDLELPSAKSQGILDFEKEFLDVNLRHSRYTHSDLLLDSRAPEMVVDAHKLFLAAARDEVDVNLPQFMAEVQVLAAKLNTFSAIFGYVNTLESDRTAQWLQAEELTWVHAEELTNANKKIQDLLLKVEALEQGVQDARREISNILESLSWTITKPLRFLRRRVSAKLLSSIFYGVEKIFRMLWQKLPFKTESKVKFKSLIFNSFPAFFSKSDAYRAWKGMNFSDGESSFLDSRGGDCYATNDLYVPLLRSSPPKDLPVKLIALYLPQFHAIKQNNDWWGEGFTEWTNVKPAQPQFEGHYQPHVPDELGYYNLLDRTTQARQIELAKLYGVGGFCFYYYWFGGERLLEQPIENYLADTSLDHPFCLCWANENWSRRWDGKDSEILIAQKHSPEDDIAFATDVSRYINDSRYIKVDGKPLLVVYRPSLLPSAFESSVRWREWFRAHGFGEIYLAYTQSFEVEDPRKYGFDAAIEFPPNNSAPPNITSSVEPLASSTFYSTVYDWAIFPERARHYKKSAYKLFRSVCPSWDNTARRKNRGTVFLNSSPNKYQEWLERAIVDTCENTPSLDERLVFVNAWNEWAEGAHLEPDQKYGYAWLDATRKALTGEGAGLRREKIVVVSHDAHPHGAQFLALGMVRTLANDLKFEVHTVLLGEGRLKQEFARYSSVCELFPGADFSIRAKKLAENLAAAGVSRAVVNTTVSGVIVDVFKEMGIGCVTLIHEMPGVIESNNLQSNALIIAKNADKVIFPAKIVKEGFKNFAAISDENTIVRPQGLWRRNFNRFRKSKVRLEVRSLLGVAENAPLVLAVGYADRRKGVDLFARAALGILEQIPSAIFVWIGHWDEELRREVDIIIDGKSDSFKFLGYEPDTARYHAAADVYALASREDPFPNVVLESFDAAVPVVAFSGTGGGAHLVSKIGGRVVPAEDVQAFASTIVDLLNHPEVAKELGAQASTLVDRDYAFRSYLFDLCDFAGVKLPKISVVVPNYNYATHISRRLDSIVNQTLPIFELIILDDASTDSSVNEIIEWLEKNNVESKLIINDKNSGCVFDQWAKGVEVATGDYIWIAEADDLSSPQFLETVLAPLERDLEVTLSFCESQQIDGLGNRVSLDYKIYRADICKDHWHVPFIRDGVDEVANYMAIKNTIPNVSSVLFRSSRIKKVFSESLDSIRVLGRAGDWLAYVEILKAGKIAFSPRPLNLHRRHSGSVIGGSNTRKLVEEISVVQRHIVKHFPVSEKSRAQAESYLKGLHMEHRLGARTLDHD